MGDRVVVYSIAADAESASGVAQRLRSNGIEIIEEQAHMLLVCGNRKTISRAIKDTAGWSISELRTVPHPQTRPRVLKKPQ
jgi:hypothetical protein